MKPSISGQWNPPHGRKLRALWDGHLETNSPDALGVFYNIPWWNLPWWWNHHFETTQVGWKKLSISQAGAAFPGKKSLTVLPNVPGFETNGSKSWSIFGSPQKVLIFCCLWWIFHLFRQLTDFFYVLSSWLGSHSFHSTPSRPNFAAPSKLAGHASWFPAAAGAGHLERKWGCKTNGWVGI